jgi:hypothetical protein
VPEFLEFFTTPSHIRMAKSATAAVRMSLDLLQLTADEQYLQQQGDEEEGAVDEQVPEGGEQDADVNAKVRLTSLCSHSRKVHL